MISGGKNNIRWLKPQFIIFEQGHNLLYNSTYGSEVQFGNYMIVFVTAEAQSEPSKLNELTAISTR